MSTLEVPVRQDEHGAAVWETRSVDTFALKGDPAKAQKAIEKSFFGVLQRPKSHDRRRN